jgi:hypothetical protein
VLLERIDRHGVTLAFKKALNASGARFSGQSGTRSVGQATGVGIAGRCGLCGHRTGVNYAQCSRPLPFVRQVLAMTQSQIESALLWTVLVLLLMVPWFAL